MKAFEISFKIASVSISFVAFFSIAQMTFPCDKKVDKAFWKNKLEFSVAFFNSSFE